MADKAWVVDASMRPIGGQLCFCPIKGEIDGEFSVMTGMNSNVPLGGKLVAIWHPDGQEAVERFCEKYADILESKYWEQFTP